MSQATPKTKPASPASKQKPAAKKPKRKPLKPWNVVLIDDDEHSYAYVVDMLGKICGHSSARAFRMAREVDTRGRVIVFTGHKELAELKREQIATFGLDVRSSKSTGSMRATLEEAP